MRASVLTTVGLWRVGHALNFGIGAGTNVPAGVARIVWRRWSAADRDEGPVPQAHRTLGYPATA
jgi:hypothetical protein